MTSSSARFRIAILVFASLIYSLNTGQRTATGQEPELLTTAASIQKVIESGQAHQYQISIQSGQTAIIEVEQHGAEALVSASGPDGKEFAAVDLRAGDGTGTEALLILARVDGAYRIKVLSRNAKGTRGNYEIRVAALRDTTDRDRSYFRAQSLCFEAQPIGLERSPEAKRKAVKLYEEALPIWRAISESQWEAALQRRLGRLNIDLTNFRRAKEYYLQALAKYKEIGDRQGEVVVQSGVCESMNYLDEARESVACIDTVIGLYEKLGNRLEQAKARANQAGVLNKIGEYRAALLKAQEALPLTQAEGDRVLEAFTLNNIGEIYQSLNESQLALDYLERALAIRRNSPDLRRWGLTLGSIAAVYSELGDFVHAQDYYNQSLAKLDEAHDRASKAAILQNLGVLWMRQREPEKAIDALTQAQAIAHEVGNPFTEGRSLVALAEIQLNRGEKDAAYRTVNTALEIARACGDRITETAAIRKLGNLASSNSDYARASEYYKQSLVNARALGSLQEEHHALVNLSRSEQAQNHLTEASDYLTEAIELIESLRAKILRPDLRTSYLASQQEAYELAMDLRMQMHAAQPRAGHINAAFELSERARARSLLETITEARAGIRRDADPRLLAEESDLADRIRGKEIQRAQLAASSRGAKQAEALAKEIDLLLTEYQSLQGKIRAQNPSYAVLTQPQPLSIAELQSKHLDDRSVLLEFALGDKKSWLWAVSRNEVLGFPLPPRLEIEMATRSLYELLSARQPHPNESSIQLAARIKAADASLPKELTELSRLLLGPLAGRLNREWAGKRLLIVPSGALDYVSFAALPVPNGKRLLLEDHEIVNLPSASVLAAIRQEATGRPKSDGTLAVFADPVFDLKDPRVASAGNRTNGPNATLAISTVNKDLLRSATSVTRAGFSKLPFSRKEADAIAAYSPPAGLLFATGFKANRPAAISEELAKYRIIHFATHGLLNNDRPELSGLVLSLVNENGLPQDGFLRMADIYNQHLPADLVVLSACQTALGKEIRGEGLVSLTRGFMHAGAERVVASLWQVDDLATAELMKRFYRGMLKEGLRPAAALRAAQLEIARQKQWTAPFYWAAFTIQGEWR